jgi:hypothetical protein
LSPGSGFYVFYQIIFAARSGVSEEKSAAANRQSRAQAVMDAVATVL